VSRWAIAPVFGTSPLRLILKADGREGLADNAGASNQALLNCTWSQAVTHRALPLFAVPFCKTNPARPAAPAPRFMSNAPHLLASGVTQYTLPVELNMTGLVAAPHSPQ